MIEPPTLINHYLTILAINYHLILRLFICMINNHGIIFSLHMTSLNVSINLLFIVNPNIYIIYLPLVYDVPLLNCYQVSRGVCDCNMRNAKISINHLSIAHDYFSSLLMLEYNFLSDQYFICHPKMVG